MDAASLFKGNPENEIERVTEPGYDKNSSSKAKAEYKMRCEDFCSALQEDNFNECVSKMSGLTKFRSTSGSFKFFIKTIEEFQTKI
jgi:hypothetical protein